MRVSSRYKCTTSAYDNIVWCQSKKRVFRNGKWTEVPHVPKVLTSTKITGTKNKPTIFQKICNWIDFDTVVNFNVTVKSDDIEGTENGGDWKENFDNDIRVNEINMQMLSTSLHTQIFKNDYKQERLSSAEIKSIKHNLSLYGIQTKDASRLPNVDIKLPPLEGNDIEQHFYNIGEAQVKPYVTIIKETLKSIPKMPDHWMLKEGWTRYTPDGVESVDYPLEDGIIFDVEVCMKEGPLPTIATAVTNRAWYGWVSKSLMDGVTTNFEGQQFTMDQLIPIESKPTEHGEKLTAYHKQPKVIVGHNVSYDRSRIKEQYWLNPTGTRFIDTMSLHVSVSGISSYQRTILNSKKNTCEKTNLHMQTSLNSLSEVHKFYCGNEISKESRNVFVEGTLNDVRKDFNSLMTYCAGDVVATYNILCKLFPTFEERFPHPVTLNYETKFILSQRANAVCQLMHNGSYEKNLWMWNEDWSTQKIKVKTSVSVVDLKREFKELKTKKEESDAQKYLTDGEEEEEDPLEEEFGYLQQTRKLLPAKLPHMPGYPAWYRKLCAKLNDKNWEPGPQYISTSMQIVPKLLNLTWECYPLHYIRDKGWGILVPFNDDLDAETKVPLKQLLAQCPLPQMEHSTEETEYLISTLDKTVEMNLHKQDFWYFKKKKKKSDFDISKLYKGTAVWCDEIIDNCCYFLKLPHKDGGTSNVGNPLAKDFLNKFSENILAGLDSSASEVLKIAKMISYWRNNRDRIMSQFVVWFSNSCLPNTMNNTKKSLCYGAIIPLVVVCGTLTRRAVESTWMTASNGHIDRVGSELRAMIQAPPGYNIIGADVDSQELWISSMLGDANYKNIQGGTPFGWMTLIGTKSNETDMHSVTAKAIGISRNQAKIINYARIYGAGQKFAERLLKQFNPNMTNAEAASKSRKMFAMTKGKRLYRLKPEYINEEILDKEYSAYEASRTAKLFGKTLSEMFSNSKWTGGSESAMFNRLEEIANSEHPVTPFLNSRLTRALENETSSKYLPTKVNWVVQSGAVDFLHLMLVSMKWLMKDNIRFCLSFHDEVRYMVPSEYKYNAALAMHVTNLMTRCFCASRLGMKDLPMSVAFFTSVEVDTVLRKESKDDCRTPSNPHGLKSEYDVPLGESLDIWETIRKSEGSFGPWHETEEQDQELSEQEAMRINDRI
ncbi:PREDICTED: LOW QUALITY PROTEIN: DNA polymerase subunit gamma-1, mitochondrial [Dufourea novaeangliae]|uniref:LOW QUALITY PROTEIN: DNA polymerase subunit gamma-1, mitochondrial n=1 Tax=Dufourea novaeangliae TaxID=178035 RepID=UPI000767A1F7|nr:PREDICTED: LOW QUALITY PROTEIN: DNA polymerase subunit gamma-1, mitochondrial [Dufourea novaeangliae]